MLNWYKKIQPQKDGEQLDALVALQMLEEQELSKEQDFFRITRQIQSVGIGGRELENELPQLLKTKREKALYETFMLLIKTLHSRHHRGTAPMVSQLGAL